MKILILAYDWRGFSLSDPDEVIRRLNRDGFDPQTNIIDYIQIGPVAGTNRISEHVTSRVVWFPFRHVRPLSDFVLGIVAWYKIVRGKISPDLVVAAEASMVWWILFLNKKFQIGIFVNSLHRDLAKKMGKIIRYGYVVATEWFVRGRVDHAMVISQDSYEYAKTHLGVAESSIHFFTPQTFDHDARAAMLQSEKIKKDLNIPVDAIIMVSVSRLEPEKGIDQLIEAMASQEPNVHLVIVGDGSLRGTFEKRSLQEDVAGRIHFIGSVKHDDVWSYYYFANLYVQPSQSEALGLSVLEAMVARVPVAAFAVGGLRDSIGGHLNRGWFLDDQDLSQSLRKTIQQVSQAGSLIEGIKNRAEQYVREKIKNAPKIQSFISL